MRRNTLLRLRNLWYLVDLLDQVSRDIVLEPRIICMLVACQYEDSESCKIYISLCTILGKLNKCDDCSRI